MKEGLKGNKIVATFCKKKLASHFLSFFFTQNLAYVVSNLMLILVCVIVTGLIILLLFLFFLGMSLATMGRIHLDWGLIPSRDFSFKVYMKLIPLV